MFDDEFFATKNAGIWLLVSSLVVTLTQILATTWCNANSDYFGYFIDETQQWHSCVYEMPGDWFFTYGALLLNTFGALNLCVEAMRTKNVWLETKTVNLSRIVFSLSLLSINLMLETLSRTWQRPGSTGILNFLFDYFWYLFPVALLLALASVWSIVNKVELIFTLNKRRR